MAQPTSNTTLMMSCSRSLTSSALPTRDDILVYSETLSEHWSHVDQVLEKLQEAGLLVNITKSQFHVQEVAFLSMIIFTHSLKMDPKNIATIKVWEAPKTIRDVQSFIVFANFYRRFIKCFLTLAQPLTCLTRIDVKFHVPSAALALSESLKSAFTSAPVLAHFDSVLEPVMETDASDYVSTRILSQGHSEGLRPTANYSTN